MITLIGRVTPGVVASIGTDTVAAGGDRSRGRGIARVDIVGSQAIVIVAGASTLAAHANGGLTAIGRAAVDAIPGTG
jgi:hypothetical protein